jgi:ATP-binding cassette, subfamily C (CFTR/MRP), member 1
MDYSIVFIGFSKDIAATEDTIPVSIKALIDYILSLTVTIIIISSATPLLLFALIPTIVVYIFVQRYFIPTNRQLIRMFSVSKSPIFVHFSDTQSGIMTLRAYRLTEIFIKKMESIIDQSFRTQYAISFANR